MFYKQIGGWFWVDEKLRNGTWYPNENPKTDFCLRLRTYIQDSYKFEQIYCESKMLTLG